MRPRTNRPSRTRPSPWVKALAVSVVLLAAGQSAQSQWAASGDNIYNTNTGSVGIGTTTPHSQLHMYNPGTYGAGITIDSPGTGGSQQAKVDFMTFGNGTKGTFQPGTKGWHLTARGNAYAAVAEQNDFGLFYWNGTSNYLVATYWDSLTGNVGLGTMNPTQKLSVVGTGAYFNSTPVQPSGVRGLFMGNFSVGSSIWSYDYVNGTGDKLQLSAQDINLNTYVGGTGVTRLYISNNGNVGVGTASTALALFPALHPRADESR